MNAKVGACYKDKEESIELVPSENEERHLEFCSMNEYVITGTLFAQSHKDIHKNTWTSPDKGTTNQIDYVLVNQR